MVLCRSPKESSGADLEGLFQLIFMRTEVEEVRIEKKYYDIASRECNEICAELIREKEELTEEEWEAEARATEADLEKLKRRCEEESRKWKKVPDEKKQKEFQILSDCALWLAEYMGLNIVVEQPDQFRGRIVLEAELFLMTCNTSHTVNEILCSLIQKSSQYCLSCSSGLWEMEFQFDLYREVPVEQE